MTEKNMTETTFRAAFRASLPVMADTVMINRPIHFEQIASMLNVSMDCLRDMNPHYKRDVVPAQKKPFALRLPVDQSLSFVTLEDTLYQLNRSKYFPNDRLVVETIERV